MEMFTAYNISLGQKIKLERLARGWRQIDLASKACVQTADVTAIEKDRYLPKNRKRKILQALGLSETGNA